MPHLVWQKSTFSGGGEGNCVELAAAITASTSAKATTPPPSPSPHPTLWPDSSAPSNPFGSPGLDTAVAPRKSAGRGVGGGPSGVPSAQEDGEGERALGPGALRRLATTRRGPTSNGCRPEWAHQGGASWCPAPAVLRRPAFHHYADGAEPSALPWPSDERPDSHSAPPRPALGLVRSGAYQLPARAIRN
ncbi:DUF397 domain-containing protein [Streptomyces sp. NBC_01728]|uniref:DUF397 domain-containing protein n=1 Tax=unclassified Streptomyces TaxID=2593676 RepID=UPI0022537652|nr:MULTISPECIES: DUF397 domain-containing protein [unclassified Streptomyces]MCX4454299.1 DUF397 domain-containing protein [Streptomyces sp. NBC_01719]MCX4493659.1 DUF397 domain-containing protein [Streptomyces sp. NBC_01728]